MPNVGDRVIVEGNKVGQQRREGTLVESVGSLIKVRWADGTESMFTPGAGSVRYETGNGQGAKPKAAGAPAKAKAKAPAAKAKAAAPKPKTAAAKAKPKTVAKKAAAGKAKPKKK